MLLPGQNVQSTLLITLRKQLIDADSLPVAAIYRSAILTSVPVAMQRLSQGLYSYSFSVPVNWQDGDAVVIYFTYQLDGSEYVTEKLIGCVDQSANSVAYGEFRVDYVNSKAYQLNLLGEVIAEFDLLTIDNLPATRAATAVIRRPVQ